MIYNINVYLQTFGCSNIWSCFFDEKRYIFTMISLYFHLPFCSQVCSYCSFSIVANQPSHIFQAYLAKLHEEIDYYGTLYPKAEIKSIYFGG